MTKACRCGAYGEGSQHTQACKDGKRIIRQLVSVSAYEHLTRKAKSAAKWGTGDSRILVHE